MENTDDPVDRHALAAWLQDRVGAAAVEVTRFSQPKSGYSAETVMFDATIGGEDQRFVLRMETPESPVYPEQVPETEIEIATQYRAMEGVAAADPEIPLAPLYGFETDAAVLGTPFFVMGFTDGEVPIEDPIYTKAGFFIDGSPEERARMINDGLAVMARIHRIDWQDAGFDWLSPAGTEPGTTRQLDLWQDYTNRELDGRQHHLVDDAWAWLRANQPVEQPLGLSWGDPRPGNMIWQDFRCATVTDWEACSIVPAEFDLGWWLMFDRWSHETLGAPRPAGEPTRDEQRGTYGALLGRDLGDVTYYEIFAAVRYCGIVVRVMNRLVERQIMPADHTIWLDNPATVCLQQLVDEHGLD